MPPRVPINDIGNKDKRAAVFRLERAAKGKARAAASLKRSRAEAELGAAAPPRGVPRTLDNTRTLDDTVVAPGDAEVAADEAGDEFAAIFAGGAAPKVMVTTQRHPSAKVFPLIGALLGVLPAAFYYRRRHFRLRDICAWAGARGFSHLVVLVERQKRAQTLLLARLAGAGGAPGPTAAFRFSSPALPAAIAGHGARTAHAPEVVLNNFSTRLGRRFGRLLGSLFPHAPQFEGRQVVTFHNQRDFVFFRNHRYMFDEKGERAALQELGPRFTLKPLWLLAGGFDPKEGEYEWRRPSKANAVAARTRRTFVV